MRGENKYLFSPDTQDGFFPMARAESAKGQTVKDMKHYFHLYFPNGRYPAEVSDKCRRLFDQMYKLGIELLGWIWDHMDEKVKVSLLEHRGMDRDKFTLCDTASMMRTLLRVLHYPSYKDGDEEPGAVRAAAHEDINLITVLPAGSSRGLQVLLNKRSTSEQIQGSGDGTPAASETGAGGTPASGAGGAADTSDYAWYEVPSRDGSIIINIGDMLEEMTNGEYIATTHRVIKPEDEEATTIGRMAIPCFIHPYADVYLSERYPEADIFLTERLMELGALTKDVVLKIKSESVLEGLRKLGHDMSN